MFNVPNDLQKFFCPLCNSFGHTLVPNYEAFIDYLLASLNKISLEEFSSLIVKSSSFDSVNKLIRLAAGSVKISENLVKMALDIINALILKNPRVGLVPCEPGTISRTKNRMLYVVYMHITETILFCQLEKQTWVKWCRQQIMNTLAAYRIIYLSVFDCPDTEPEIDLSSLNKSVLSLAKTNYPNMMVA